MYQVVLEIREQSNNVPSRFPFDSTQDVQFMKVLDTAQEMAVDYAAAAGSDQKPLRIGNGFHLNPRPSTSVDYRVEEVHA